MNKLVPLVAFGACAILGSNANAQIIAEQRPPMDSVTQSYHDALVVIRDHLLTLRSVSDRASRNVATGASETLASQVLRLREACRVTSEAALAQRVWFDRSRATQPLAARVAAVSDALSVLSGHLTGQCIDVFNEGFISVGDSVRQWTPYYVRQLQRFSQDYYNVANALARAGNFRVEPRTNR